MELNNNDLRCASSSLYEFYSENKSTLENALSTYKLSKSESSDRDIQLLQRATIEKIAKEINARAENYNGVTLLIHGYRNSPEWAQQGYDKVKSFVENKYNSKQLYVELYWDGLVYTKYNVIKAWDNAQAHSYLVGLELRKLLTKLEIKSLNVIAHSTGANVISTALINQTSKLDTSYWDEYSPKLKSEHYKTPDINSIKVALFAAAMPGESTFVDYDERNTTYDFLSKDNYHFYISLNTNDPALNKYGLDSIIRGATTLGRDKAEQDKVSALFDGNGPLHTLNSPIFFDFSWNEDDSAQDNHRINGYLEHSSARDMLDELFLKK